MGLYEDMEKKSTLKLKKEAFRVWLTQGSPEAFHKYRQARRAAAEVVSDEKTRTWEEFGEAMEKDFRWPQGGFGKPSDGSGREGRAYPRLFSAGGGSC